MERCIWIKMVDALVFEEVEEHDCYKERGDREIH